MIVLYGNRYAPDQFESYLPDDLSPCHLVAGGGVASWVATQHCAMKHATEITPLGLLADVEGERLNMAEWGSVDLVSKRRGLRPWITQQRPGFTYALMAITNSRDHESFSNDQVVQCSLLSFVSGDALTKPSRRSESLATSRRARAAP